MLENLRENFERLIALYESQRQDNVTLRSEIESLRAENNTLNKQITELRKQVDNLRLADVFKTPSDRSGEAEEKIEKLIKEIDRCISLLEN